MTEHDAPAPQPGPVDVEALRAGDVVRQLDWDAITTVDDVSHQGGHVGVSLDGKYGVWPAASFTFIARPGVWTEWSGGENPVPGMVVDIKLRDGSVIPNDSYIDNQPWRHMWGQSDIVAFRIPLADPVEAASVEGGEVLDLLSHAKDAVHKIAAARRSIGPLATQAQTAGHAIAQAIKILRTSQPVAHPAPDPLAVAVEALKPFAINIHPDHGDEDSFRSYFRAGDIRRAAAALATLNKRAGE